MSTDIKILQRKKILVVEDVAIVAMDIRNSLESLGYHVTGTVPSGHDALNSLAQTRPELVLMDIMLKGSLDGIETADIIKQEFDIPVLYLTAYADEEMLNRAKITEPFGYILKPFQERELMAAIEMALYKHGMENKLKQLAHYDCLTALPNRTLFFDRFAQSLKAAKRSNHTMAVLVIDLDDFKSVNDTMGHDSGDRLLQEAAKRLSECVRESDTVARLGGDEFAMLLTNLSTDEDTDVVAAKIILSFERPFIINRRQCKTGASIGISLFPADGDTEEKLLKKADIAMYIAKENGKNQYRFFSENRCTTTIE
ncbi:diguanylate cyclase domain-containing protein [Candidatus Magnetomonas plexicatena]|uniref:diguanylate cyclase domain-containing protein n=1 Tax=Candidatus Magnetomonas plexicatena TaxID=2552947 RepID=UPI001C7584C8|nr:GGDEF domain-containing response regulator [Nitrospirales bacterium LBB_01]